ncbi:hypothetical protein FRB96_008378 [Tulasnella sp. 330]|nr:hypothetical protein FRB96_008378 [Tulasnella sp. 330]KAG8879755.1 hypothetical protein FRB97_001451 [Tulasnella sp. 331]
MRSLLSRSAVLKHGRVFIRANSTKAVPLAVPLDQELSGSRLRVLTQDSRKLAGLIAESQERPSKRYSRPRQANAGGTELGTELNRAVTSSPSIASTAPPTANDSQKSLLERSGQRQRGATQQPKSSGPRTPRQPNTNPTSPQSHRTGGNEQRPQRFEEARNQPIIPPSADLSAPSVSRPPFGRGTSRPNRRPLGPTFAERTRKKLLQDTSDFRRSVTKMKIPDNRDEEDADKLVIQQPQRSMPLSDLRRVLEPTALLSKSPPLPLQSPKLDILSSNIKYQMDMERLRALPVTSEGLTVTQRAFHAMTRNPTITVERKRRSLERIAKLVGDKLPPKLQQVYKSK